MGQRLNLEIVGKKGQRNGVFANAYYHWSGYTSSAVKLTEKVIEAIKMQEDEKTNKTSVEIAIDILSYTGAKLTDEEIEYAKKNIENFHTNHSLEERNRNAGLIAISSKGIQETRKYEESRVQINIDTKTVNFDCFNIYGKTIYNEYCSSIKFEDLKEYDINYDFKQMSFSDFENFANIIKENIEKRNYNIRIENKKGKVLSFIE